MNVYTYSTNRTVHLDIPVVANSGTLDVKILDGETELYDVPTVAYENGRYSFSLPFFLSREERELTVHWSFTYTENGETYEFDEYTPLSVVTPLLTKAEIKQIHPNATDDEVVRIEEAVRLIIQAHTGQKFGKFIGTYSVKGSDGNVLQLPARLLKLTSVNGLEDNPNRYFFIGGDGWTLQHFPWGVPPVKADYHELHQHVGGVIHNPNMVKLGEFYKSMTYNITGEWGWDRVPDAVKEAAKLLVNDYACGDAAYRDRYLTSMTAADWRIQFNSGAFARTGNVRADQLLSDYVLKRGWAVI